MVALDPRLEADTLSLGSLFLCRVMLSKNAAWPWLILVPDCPDVSEITDLSEDDQLCLWQEIATVSRALQELTGAHKMNIAALGNIVRQLHVHVVARFEGDPAWPAPIWGSGHSKEWDVGARDKLIAGLKDRLPL